VVGKRFAPLTPPPQVPEVALFELGLSLLRLMIRKDAASLFRIAVAEAPRAPKLGAIFYAQGPGTTLKRLASICAPRLIGASCVAESRCVPPSSSLAQSWPNIICVA
jgi:hypothetical protein